MMRSCLKDQIGRNAQVYTGDVIIITKTGGSPIEDLHETFANLRRFNIKLNPAKSAFGIPGSLLFEYLINGIRGNSSPLAPYLEVEVVSTHEGTDEREPEEADNPADLPVHVART